MIADGWRLTHDIDAFLDRCGDVLSAHAALHTLPLTDIAKPRTPEAGGHDAVTAVFGTLESRGRGPCAGRPLVP